MITTYFKNLVANHVWHTAGETALPSSYYLAISSTEPKEDGTGVTEPTAISGYARTKMSGLGSAVNGEVANEIVIAWPKFLKDEGGFGYWALYDTEQSGTGHLLMGDRFDSVKHIDAGTTMSIETNGLTLRVLGE